jgi:hypothetical protein
MGYARGEVLTARGSCGGSRSTRGRFRGLNTACTECYHVVFSANIHANRTGAGGLTDKGRTRLQFRGNIQKVNPWNFTVFSVQLANLYGGNTHSQKARMAHPS